MIDQPQRRNIQIKMNAVVIAIDSNHDFATTAAFNYRQKKVYPCIDERGFVIERCQGQLARRIYVALAASKSNVVYLTGVGHGSYDTFTGEYHNPIFTVGNYSPEESQGKIIHFLSCQIAALLGVDFVKYGCRAFFGYDIDFTFAVKTADIFFECDSEIDRAFAEGLTAEEVYQRVYTLYTKYADESFWQGDLNTFKYLETDRDHLCAPSVDRRWGDPLARLE
ncbi:MAG: hypothetical protein RMY64_06785 [Nostoc sp. DedQUE08]|uniref:hypothetical protein n=1 Tax=Nostoc sp. DedQUE08 TaxID=3075393 RepID=UPI002AD28C16|nr:hypothetical protein [Nostoc sp. DedQUE08]MDZ8065332.1 hypothetical protein [Nostoc sp. DedQUE08]